VPYGLFIGEVVNFVIVAPRALPLYREVPRLGDEGKGSRAAPPTKQETLLAEIRDLLKAQRA